MENGPNSVQDRPGDPNLYRWVLYRLSYILLLMVLMKVTEGLLNCWSFMSMQHIRSYQDRYRLVTVCTHGDFIVLPHREIRQLAS